MEILNVKIEKETKEKIDRLAKAKRYKNRSEALRRMIEEHFDEHPALFADEEIKEIIREASKISNAKFDALAAEIFRGRKTAGEMVGEGRERSRA